MTYDLIVRGARIVRPDGVEFGDVAVADGVIAAIGPEVEGDAAEELAAGGRLLLPGAVDAHVHLNDPGRADWEGFASGTRALAAGGFACAIDMPLHSVPSTVSASAFDAKLAAALGTAHVDFALWGGLVPGSVGQMGELAERGVVGFKAFMADSGNDDFAACDALTLYEGMCRAAELGLPVAVHAENAAMVRELGRRAL